MTTDVHSWFKLTVPQTAAQLALFGLVSTISQVRLCLPLIVPDCIAWCLIVTDCIAWCLIVPDCIAWRLMVNEFPLMDAPRR